MRIVLTDPYGNRFESENAFGLLRVRTGRAPAPVVLADETFDGWTPERRVVVKLPGNRLDEQGEVQLFFTSDPARKAYVPVLKSAAGVALFQSSGFRVGGAQMELEHRKEAPL